MSGLFGPFGLIFRIRRIGFEESFIARP